MRVVVVHVVERNLLDRVRVEEDDVDVVDDEQPTAEVGDLHVVPRVLDLHLTGVAEDLAVRIGVVGLEVDLAFLVVQQVTDDDPIAGSDRVTDPQQTGVRVRAGVVGTHIDVAGLGNDRAVGVDGEERVRLAQEDDGRLPEDLALALQVDLAVGLREAEAARGADVVAPTGRVVGLPPQVGGTDDRLVATGDAGHTVVVDLRERFAVTEAAAALRSRAHLEGVVAGQRS